MPASPVSSGIMNDSILPSDRAAVLNALGLSDDEHKEDYGSGKIANGLTSSPRLTEQNTASSNAARPPPAYKPTKAASVFPETTEHHRVGSAALHTRSTIQSAPAVPDIDRNFSLTDNDARSDGGVADGCDSAANVIQDANNDPFARPHIMSPRGDRYQFIAEPGSPPITNFRNFSPSPSPSATSNLGSRVTPLHPHSPSYSRTISGGTPISFGNQPQSTVPFVIPSSPVSTGGRSDVS
ncbi:hypothetical protein AZE42_12267 [Rhizopogon vesiculosus]|uniref:Uncharacterized protein n=1 Tax=Rhizopogon vesiculosus TaxID=180088 RepID=A0A1J8PUS0_9AGAM|nr:hypothetical protein AZE42_12267 [Rhizopogon vesiculosus]